MPIKDTYVFTTIAWIIFEIVYLIEKLWYKNNIKKNNVCKIIEILPDDRIYKSWKTIYARVLVDINGEKKEARCYGWYPKVDEEAIIKYHFLINEQRCYEMNKLKRWKIYLILMRIYIVILYFIYVMAIIQPEFIKPLVRALIS